MSSTPPQVQVRPQGKSGLGTAAIVKLAVAGGIALLILIFILQNTETVEWSFLFWGFQLAKWLMLVFTLVIGFLAGMLVNTLLWRRRRKEARRRVG
ncbi:MAG: LapA family protein [Thermoleophilia bacterium]